MSMSPNEIAAKLDSLQSLRLTMRRVCADLAESSETTPEQMLEAARTLSALARKMKSVEAKYLTQVGPMRPGRYASRARR
jgi:hypothetical protein